MKKSTKRGHVSGAIRFMDAFRSSEGASFEERFDFETAPAARERAAVPVRHGRAVWLTALGFFYRREAVKVAFSGDVWSEVRANGALVATHRASEYGHEECFLRRDTRPVAVVVDQDYYDRHPDRYNAVCKLADRAGLPVLPLSAVTKGANR